MDNQTIDQALEAFLAYCNKLVADHYATMPNYPENCRETLKCNKGKRYAKFVRGLPGAKSGSAYCFVDMTNGDILKAASWAAPAKISRGNLFYSDTWGCMTPYGAMYLR